MSGVIRADIAVFKSYGGYMLFLPLLYAIIGVVNPFFRIFCSILVVMLTINIIAYNERDGFEKYMMTMPVKRSSIVLARYAEPMFLSIAMLLFQFAASYIVRVGGETMPIGELLTNFGMTAIYTALVMPIILKLGVEKGRTAYMIVFVGSAVLVGVVSEWLGSGYLVSLLQMGSIGLGLVLVVISYFISVKVYENKQF